MLSLTDKQHNTERKTHTHTQQSLSELDLDFLKILQDLASGEAEHPKFLSNILEQTMFDKM